MPVLLGTGILFLYTAQLNMRIIAIVRLVFEVASGFVHTKFEGG